jgi:hypothetical protein
VGWNTDNEKWLDIEIEKLLLDYNNSININNKEDNQSQEIKTDI